MFNENEDKWSTLREELGSFYQKELDKRVDRNKNACWKAMDERIPGGLTAFEQKGRQYEIVPEFCEPILFRNVPFYFETCTVGIVNKVYPTGYWTYRQNQGIYREVDASLIAERDACAEPPLYTFCGAFGDEFYHFVFNMQEIISHGVKGVWEKTQRKLEESSTPEKRSYYENTLRGLKALGTISALFARAAKEKLASAESETQRRNLRWVMETAEQVPWNPPRTFREGLNTVAFLHRAVPTLEGGSISGMGRLDQMLYPLYRRDLESGAVREEEIYDDICAFMLIWDAHWDPDWKQQGTEMNDRGFTITLGGCLEDGSCACNDLTRLFLKAQSDLKVIYPKIKFRFDRNTPDVYLEIMNRDIAAGRTTILYQNDEAFLPALIREGISPADARNYSFLGCWEPVIPGATNEHCGYVSLLKILELSVFNDFNREGIALRLTGLDDAESFEEVYERVVTNIRSVLFSRAKIVCGGRALWSRVDPHLLMSSVLDDCLEKGVDLTRGGARYNIDEMICAGFPNVVDSLLAIEELCFEKRKLSLREFLSIVRQNWEGHEDVRRMALESPFYGDEGQRSRELAARLSGDIYRISQELPTLWNGKTAVGYMLFMEMMPWSRKMRATPDGRRNQDYFARGLTPSSLHFIPSVTAVLNTLNSVDSSCIAANSVLNITVPYANLPQERWSQLIHSVAATHVEALQLNCATREELLDAQKHPEKYPNLVVRVCGFSAKFTSLSTQMQNEYLERNFFES